MYQCIGKFFRNRVLVQCSNTSETPSRADHPEWGFLCPNCSAARPAIPRKAFQAPVLDLDKPNQIEPEEPGDLPEDGYTRLEELDQDDFDSLQEIDL